MQKEAEGLVWTEDIKAEDKLWADGYLCACMNACVCVRGACMFCPVSPSWAHIWVCALDSY